MSLTKEAAIHKLRTRARELGMVFRVQKKRIGGIQAYELTNRETGELIKSNLTVFIAFDDMKAGRLETLARQSNCQSQHNKSNAS